MIYSISKAIGIINNAIADKRKADFLYDFTEDFEAGDKQLYNFIRNVTRNNRIDRLLVMKQPQEQQQKYLENILSSWAGMNADDINEIFSEKNSFYVPAVTLFSVKYYEFEQYFRNDDAAAMQLIKTCYEAERPYAELIRHGNEINGADYTALMQDGSIFVRTLEFDFNRELLTIYDGVEVNAQCRLSELPALYDSLANNDPVQPALDNEDDDVEDDDLEM